MKMTMDEIKNFEWDIKEEGKNTIEFHAVIKNNNLSHFTINQSINYCIISDIDTLKQIRDAMTDVLKELGE